MDNKDKILNLVFSIIGAVLLLFSVYKLYINMISYPLPPTLNIWLYAYLGVSVIITVITYKKVLVAANIINGLNVILAMYNTLGFLLFSKISIIYADKILSYKSLINYTYESSISTFKILVYLGLAVLLLLWLKYVLIIKHNLTERQ